MSNDNWKSEQEAFWAGNFGDEYVDRNLVADHLSSRIFFLGKALARSHGIRSIIEFGANTGVNMVALKSLFPGVALSAVEINAKAVAHLNQIEGVSAHRGSFVEPYEGKQHDLSMTSGVMMHLNPDLLPIAYDNLYAASRRYILVKEYYSPFPMEVPYRGEGERLYKRDWGADLLDRFADLQLVDYGFQYKRDPNFPADNSNWFLFEKRG